MKHLISVYGTEVFPADSANETFDTYVELFAVRNQFISLCYTSNSMYEIFSLINYKNDCLVHWDDSFKGTTYARLIKFPKFSI